MLRLTFPAVSSASSASSSALVKLALATSNKQLPQVILEYTSIGPPPAPSVQKVEVMASGYGLNGGVSRCFPFWQEYLACHIINQNDPEARRKGVCAPVLEDYYECLHHKKEYARAQAIQDAYRKAEAAHPRENAPKAGEIRSLGLIGKEEESKKVLKSQ